MSDLQKKSLQELLRQLGALFDGHEPTQKCVEAPTCDICRCHALAAEMLLLVAVKQ